MGTSIRQLTEQLAWCFFSLFHLGLIFAFISWAPSVPSPQGSAQRSRPFVWDAVEIITCRGLTRPPTALQPPPPESTASSTLCPHFEQATGPLSSWGEKPRETESTCLRGAEPVPWVSVSLPTPRRPSVTPGREQSEARRPLAPAAGTARGPCGWHSSAFCRGAGLGTPGQVPLSPLPSGGCWVPSSREGRSGVHFIPQPSMGHRVEHRVPGPRDAEMYGVPVRFSGARRQREGGRRTRPLPS